MMTRACPSSNASESCIPLSFDPETSNLLAGGRYPFDTEEHADVQALVEGYRPNGIRFLERPVFIEPNCHAWSAIGAHDVTDAHTTHVVLRTERWQMRAS